MFELNNNRLAKIKGQSTRNVFTPQVIRLMFSFEKKKLDYPKVSWSPKLSTIGNPDVGNPRSWDKEIEVAKSCWRS